MVIECKGMFACFDPAIEKFRNYKKVRALNPNPCRRFIHYLKKHIKGEWRGVLVVSFIETIEAIAVAGLKLQQACC